MKDGTEGQDRENYSDEQDRKSYVPDEDRHSVNCYFCGKLFDEREGVSADQWNENDGGEACPECAKERERRQESLQEDDGYAD